LSLSVELGSLDCVAFILLPSGKQKLSGQKKDATNGYLFVAGGQWRNLLAARGRETHYRLQQQYLHLTI